MRQQRVPERSPAIISPETSGPITSTSFDCLRVAIRKLRAARKVEFRGEPVVLNNLLHEASAPVARRAQDFANHCGPTLLSRQHAGAWIGERRRFWRYASQRYIREDY